jgi:F0F1-type ATP synthase assembly protein I
LLSIDTNARSSGDFTTPLIVGFVISILIGLIAGVFNMKQKN